MDSDSSTKLSSLTNDGTLPQEIVTNILSRLPVKSLCRFKCVAPSWNSLISDPHFTKIHLNRTKAQTPKRLGQTTSVISTTHDLYSINFADVNPTATKLDFPMLKQHATPDNEVIVWSSCNGLLLVSHERRFRPGVWDATNRKDGEFFLLNPANRECKKLPIVPSEFISLGWFRVSICGVGYDPLTDDYKVVMLSPCRTKPKSSDGVYITIVYSLKANAWRRIQDSHYTLMEPSCGVFFNECLHYRWWSGDSDSFKYVTFDLSDEVFREVSLPACLEDSLSDTLYPLKVLGDCDLCLVIGQRIEQLKLDMPQMSAMGFLCLLEENEYLLVANREKLVVYNPEKETMRDMVVCGIPTKYRNGVMYVESLISPHNRGRIGRQ